MGLADRLRGYMTEEEYQEESVVAYPGTNLNETPCQVVLCRPDRFDSAGEIADYIVARHIVVLNLENAPMEDTRRLLDFLSGAAYAISGTIERVSQCTYIITPENVDFEGAVDMGLHF